LAGKFFVRFSFPRQPWDKTTMNDDAHLLRSFVENHSESAFTAIVQRHLPLVYATALRQLNHDAHLAEDVTQTVFTDLARKAASLRDRTTLAGWLYASARLAAAAIVRREQRRKRRELAAHTMQLDDSPETPDAACAQLRPWLDDAIDSLNAAEREAVVLRFFQQRSFSEVGAALRVTEEAARKRVDRALEKLHSVLTRRGVTSTSAALGVALAHIGESAVPAGLAAKVAGAAVAHVAAATSVGAVAALVLPFAAGLAVAGLTLLPQHRANQSAAAELAALRADSPRIPALTAENAQLARSIADAHRLQSSADELPRLRAEFAALPQPAPAPTVNSFSLTTEGVIQWEGKPITLDEYLFKSRALHDTAPNGESKFVVRANGAKLGPVIWVVDEARKAGIKHIVVESDVTVNPWAPASWF
jgi:RNA polymerase sigma factor (sigma-70 family)